MSPRYDPGQRAAAAAIQRDHWGAPRLPDSPSTTTRNSPQQPHPFPIYRLTLHPDGTTTTTTTASPDGTRTLHSHGPPARAA
jgi:hypothetical protein